MDKKESSPDNLILKRMQIICSKQEKCTNDIRKKLAEFRLTAEETDSILNTLVRDNFVNDERYSLSFVHDKLKFNKWGKIKLGYELRSKGIGNEHISKALDSIDNSEYMSILKSELMKKLRKSRSSGRTELKGKLVRFAQSKGFENELIFNVINEILVNK
jgi:regulatory protein